MYTVGIDMTTLSRVEKSLESPAFCRRVYTQKELETFDKNTKKGARSLAANFAAKEAFAKALGSGIRGFELNEVEILRDEQGRPYFNFYGRARQIVKNMGAAAHVSLSHEGDFAIAAVILEKE